MMMSQPVGSVSSVQRWCFCGPSTGTELDLCRSIFAKLDPIPG